MICLNCINLVFADVVVAEIDFVVCIYSYITGPRQWRCRNYRLMPISCSTSSRTSSISTNWLLSSSSCRQWFIYLAEWSMAVPSFSLLLYAAIFVLRKLRTVVFYEPWVWCSCPSFRALVYWNVWYACLVQRLVNCHENSDRGGLRSSCVYLPRLGVLFWDCGRCLNHTSVFCKFFSFLYLTLSAQLFNCWFIYLLVCWNKLRRFVLSVNDSVIISWAAVIIVWSYYWEFNDDDDVRRVITCEACSRHLSSHLVKAWQWTLLLALRWALSVPLISHLDGNLCNCFCADFLLSIYVDFCCYALVLRTFIYSRHVLRCSWSDYVGGLASNWGKLSMKCCRQLSKRASDQNLFC